MRILNFKYLIIRSCKLLIAGQNKFCVFWHTDVVRDDLLKFKVSVTAGRRGD